MIKFSQRFRLYNKNNLDILIIEFRKIVFRSINVKKRNKILSYSDCKGKILLFSEHEDTFSCLIIRWMFLCTFYI